MTGIICLTLKYTVNTLLMNSEGSVRIVCSCIFMGRSLTSEENNCQIREGWPFVVLKSVSVWLWIIKYGIIKNDPFCVCVWGRVVQVKAKCHDFILETWASIISEFAWIIWLSHSKHYRDAITLIHPSASMPSVFLCSLSSTLRTVAVLGLGRGAFLSLNPLFSSHLDCRGKLLFPKLGDAFSYAGRHFFWTVQDEAKERNCFVFITIGTRKGALYGNGKKEGWEPSSLCSKTKEG